LYIIKDKKEIKKVFNDKVSLSGVLIAVGIVALLIISALIGTTTRINRSAEDNIYFRLGLYAFLTILIIAIYVVTLKRKMNINIGKKV